MKPFSPASPSSTIPERLPWWLTVFLTVVVLPVGIAIGTMATRPEPSDDGLVGETIQVVNSPGAVVAGHVVYIDDLSLREDAFTYNETTDRFSHTDHHRVVMEERCRLDGKTVSTCTIRVSPGTQCFALGTPESLVSTFRSDAGYLSRSWQEFDTSVVRFGCFR